MGKVQAYPSDEVCEKINAIVGSEGQWNENVR